MILDVSRIMKIPEDTMELSFKEDFDFIESKNGKIQLLKPVEFNGTMIKDGDILFLDGNLEVLFKLYCDRCMTQVKTPLSIRVTERFKKELPFDDEEEIHGFNGSEIDLTPILTGVILLNMPMKVVCNEECKGLCPECGQNLNEHTCDCKEEFLDSRFSALKTLFKDSE
ncbi:MAG: DUF177 domain-containing protein [Epulopiscium sp.]|nr:DUF177 domain-containing protein [Candidatus Epulonipiscium sp.]